VHPNVKLFISHGGISGVYEAVDAGVPVLGLPLFFDQPRNLENLVDAGMAIVMNLDTVSKDTLMNAILELVNNKKYELQFVKFNIKLVKISFFFFNNSKLFFRYTQNAKIASDRFKDRPLTASKTVDYWTRYVIRHKGAPHLKSQALNLKWYQYLLLDVIAVVILVILLFFYIMYKTFKFIKNIVFKLWTKSKSKSE